MNDTFLTQKSALGDLSRTMKDTGFLVLHAGGSGAIAAPTLRDPWKADGSPFPLFQVLIDTDKANDYLKDEGIVDATIPVRLEIDELETILATPWTFGPTVPRIVQQMDGMLNDLEEMENGARTVRPIAQLLWEVRRNATADALNECIRKFLRQSGCKKIIPVLATSSGGGTGSSFTILLCAALKVPAFRSLVLEGFSPRLLRTPIVFCVEPFYRAEANKDDPNHKDRILANVAAFRLEAALLGRWAAFRSMYHLGLAAPSGGVVLDDESEVGRVLGTGMYQYMRHWATKIKPRKVDRPPVDRYRGHDVPELVRQRMQNAPSTPRATAQAAPPPTPTNPPINTQPPLHPVTESSSPNGER